MTSKKINTTINLMFILLSFGTFYFMREALIRLFDFADSSYGNTSPISVQGFIGTLAELAPIVISMIVFLVVLVNIGVPTKIANIVICVLGIISAIFISIALWHIPRYIETHPYSIHEVVGKYGYWSFILSLIFCMLICAGSIFLLLYRKKLKTLDEE